MTLDDGKLLDFDKKRLDHRKESKANETFRDCPELYRNHLVIAKVLNDWHDGIEAGIDLRPEYHDGLKWALRRVAAHLRQGDYLPSGILFRQTVTGLSG